MLYFYLENDQDSIGLETNPDLADPSFYRQHRYDIKKPGPSFFFHETDSSEGVSFFFDLQSYVLNNWLH